VVVVVVAGRDVVVDDDDDDDGRRVLVVLVRKVLLLVLLLLLLLFRGVIPAGRRSCDRVFGMVICMRMGDNVEGRPCRFTFTPSLLFLRIKVPLEVEGRPCPFTPSLSPLLLFPASRSTGEDAAFFIMVMQEP
jgi:hypothetical protein